MSKCLFEQIFNNFVSIYLLIVICFLFILNSINRLNDNVCCGFMAQSEDVVRNKSSMEPEVVCISDDDDNEVGPSRPRPRQIERPRQNPHHQNVYEYYEPLPPPLQAHLEYGVVNPRGGNRLQNVQDETTQEDEVVYVPDDNEEEDLLIGPIRRISERILFQSGFTPTEFPYELLIELQKHVCSSMLNVSIPTERKVWQFLLTQLKCMQMTYSTHIDVCILNQIKLCSYRTRITYSSIGRLYIVLKLNQNHSNFQSVIMILCIFLSIEFKWTFNIYNGFFYMFLFIFVVALRWKV